MTQTQRGPGPPTTVRGQAKARRRQDLLAASATLFAERGFAGVSIDDIGAAAGVSGPAVYRHFPSKQAVLGAILLEVSLWALAIAATVTVAQRIWVVRRQALARAASAA